MLVSFGKGANQKRSGVWRQVAAEVGAVYDARRQQRPDTVPDLFTNEIVRERERVPVKKMRFGISDNEGMVGGTDPDEVDLLHDHAPARITDPERLVRMFELLRAVLDEVAIPDDESEMERQLRRIRLLERRQGQRKRKLADDAGDALEGMGHGSLLETLDGRPGRLANGGRRRYARRSSMRCFPRSRDRVGSSYRTRCKLGPSSGPSKPFPPGRVSYPGRSDVAQFQHSPVACRWARPRVGPGRSASRL